MLSYECQSSVLRNLSFVKRKQLAQIAPNVRKFDKHFGSNIGVVLMERVGCNYVVQVDSVNLEIIERRGDQACEIQYGALGERRVIVQPDKSLRFRPSVNRTVVIQAPGFSAREALEHWIDYHINRPGTCIDVFAIRWVGPVPIDRVSKVNILDIKYTPPYLFPTPLLANTTELQMVRTSSAGLLTNETMKNVKTLVFEGHDEVELENVMNLKALSLKFQDQLLEPQVAVAYCKNVMQDGRPLGFNCTSRTPRYQEFMDLDWLADQLGARKTEQMGRKCITAEIQMRPDVEFNVRSHPDNHRDLLMEVTLRGTAIERTPQCEDPPRQPYIGFDLQHLFPD